MCGFGVRGQFCFDFKAGSQFGKSEFGRLLVESFQLLWSVLPEQVVDEKGRVSASLFSWLLELYASLRLLSGDGGLLSVKHSRRVSTVVVWQSDAEWLHAQYLSLRVKRVHSINKGSGLAVMVKASTSKPGPKADAEALKQLTLRRNESARDLEKRAVRAAMDNYPRIIGALWKCCNDHDITDENVFEKCEDEEPKSNQLLARQKTKEKLRAVKDENARADAEALPKGKTLLGELKIDDVRDKLLAAMEPQALSKQNLQVLQKTVGKEGLLRLLECGTGLGPSTVLADYSTWAELRTVAIHTAPFLFGGFKVALRRPNIYLTRVWWWCLTHCRKQCIARNSLRGHRAAQVGMPPEWTQGVYGLMKLTDEGDLMVRQRFTGEVVTIERKHLPEFSSVDLLTVEMNWSEERAFVRSAEAGQRKYNLSRVFHSHELARGDGDEAMETPAKRHKAEGTSQRKGEVTWKGHKSPVKSNAAEAVVLLAESLPYEGQALPVEPVLYDDTKCAVPSPED
eukprot:6468068-Amphidinium_carterae.2